MDGRSQNREYDGGRGEDEEPREHGKNRNPGGQSREPDHSPQPGEKETTRTLGDILQEVGSRKELDRYLDRLEDNPPFSSFAAYFVSLESVKQQKLPEIQKESGIERTYFYHILSGTSRPGRDKILRLCLAAGLDGTQTRRALESGGEEPLYARSRRDAVISFAIGRHLSVVDTNLLLSEYGLELLG